jgi:hypothetical protein
VLQVAQSAVDQEVVPLATSPLSFPAPTDCHLVVGPDPQRPCRDECQRGTWLHECLIGSGAQIGRYLCKMAYRSTSPIDATRSQVPAWRPLRGG